MNKIEFTPIGTVHSPFDELEGMPIQPIGAQGIKGEIHLRDDLIPGLKDLDGFSHLTLVYYLHKVKGYSLEVKPFLDNDHHGVFATRSPRRLNPIGISVVKLDSVNENVIEISNVDILNGTPLLDIKPYVPQLYEDTCKDLKIGWFEDKHENAEKTRSDDRFID
ncbi:MAG: tRNA (N6-threonylcarbamoyladenosine(37)-N6)-methyltransferase TrmO [Methanobrevibacter arboriphilus]|jgi:tRNA-Thr(GGU) m(6)t(6)A37 methyltransferase TsaA|uniref:tRNA (N6-threonylcarbamoyladenosine(37)-N6)-methyltransferase TrmO n=2 Tax=Methanobrevibacter arboriphilus TaxID=39441 RepID=A0ACA8R1E3_METAZ|nr:tRNA (N6-threonylcarbamoyladenosine(37)-N6)-methyltransferase TrmO [Methanobrevibacter arboriphilus]MBF4468688.1 tRNA (N6-threonylcarbamoyladenosine(37)-N6)-methyltransferase TrmO [Methanobrevibacter arboriphilus]MCC7562310.1 tRNA (N6-threonylcarbamoyladenosine(37)-N6)-methyltransferase TrmO [Methanobrevibacter arboriphilus]BBL61037.1 tRNA (N6-threonylcarbamoyladenosine(37)-N6)-methyltransferase TrmO [Methanobrevibacter arboriphilus]GLI12637.1 tRNA (N6-threonylcarbamoyladenosine(37)-N6)-meth